MAIYFQTTSFLAFRQMWIYSGFIFIAVINNSLFGMFALLRDRLLFFFYLFSLQLLNFVSTALWFMRVCGVSKGALLSTVSQIFTVYILTQKITHNDYCICGTWVKRTFLPSVRRLEANWKGAGNKTTGVLTQITTQMTLAMRNVLSCAPSVCTNKRFLKLQHVCTRTHAHTHILMTWAKIFLVYFAIKLMCEFLSSVERL